jgi:integrase
MTVRQAAESLWASVDAECGERGEAGRRKVRACLKRFLDQYGPRLVHEVIPADLVAFKTEVCRDLKPNSANDILCYTRRLLNHAWEIDAIAEPFRLKALKNVKREPLTKRAASVADVTLLLRLVSQENANLGLAMYLQFLGVMRPSEVSKVIHGEGEWDGTGVFCIDGKTTNKTGELRPVILTDPALDVLKSIEKKWARGALLPNGNSYRHMCWKVGRRLKEKHPEAQRLIRALTGRDDLSPHRLRHAAVQALIDAGVAEEHRRLAMGRLAPRLDRTYGTRPNCAAVRKAIGVLAELIPPTVLDVQAKDDRRRAHKPAA